MTKNKRNPAVAAKFTKRLERGAEQSQERRQARRDGELSRLTKLRDGAKGPAREWLTKRLAARREALERRAKRKTERSAKRATRRARTRAGRQAEPVEEPASGGGDATDPLDGMNAAAAIEAVGAMDAETLALARTSEEGGKERTTVLAAIDARELELAAE